jgi:hypothetical protein
MDAQLRSGDSAAVRRGLISIVMLSARLVAAQGWLGDFAERAPIVVTSARRFTDFQLAVIVNTFGLRAGCPDLRFTAADGVTILPHWVESGCGTVTTRVWVRVPELVDGEILYVYSGSATAIDSSDGAAVHLFFWQGTTDPTVGPWFDIARESGMPSHEFIWNAGPLELVDNTIGRGGGATALLIDPAWEEGFEIDLRYRLSALGGMNGGGDGFAVGFFHEGNSGGGGSLNVGAHGYAAEFDLVQNAFDPSGDHIALVRTSATSNGFKHLAYSDQPLLLHDRAWHTARVQVLAAEATIWVDGALIVTLAQTWDKTYRRILVGAATGADVGIHEIDEVRILRSVSQPPAVAVGPTEAMAREHLYRVGCSSAASVPGWGLVVLFALARVLRRRARASC